MHTPRLSFILPVYKPKHEILERCIKSLLAQSLKEWEAVFVLDGADEDAARLIARLMKKWPDHKIVQIDHGGACKARNEGFKHTSQTPYVVFWDSDCEIEPHAAKNWVDILDRNKDVGFVYGGYKFFGERGAINSEPFDPWLLRVSNYISTCFPLRRELVGLWDEDLESLQDWDFWLSVVERGGVGKYLAGYAFSTAYPTPESISGKGCTPEAWLGRKDKVRAKHKIPCREVCVTSLSDKHDGIALAKLIDADYEDRPNDKPNHYKTIIQIGFSLNPGVAGLHASLWGPQHKKVLFWTKDNVEEIYHAVSLKALEEYTGRFNQAFKMFVEDKASQRIMDKAGFQTQILPLPIVHAGEIPPMPETPKFLVDASAQYQHALSTIKRACPDIDIDTAGGVHKIEDYTGVIHFWVDRCMSPALKRMLVTGRHVVSNVQSPYAGFLDDRVTDEQFIVSMVERLRKLAKEGPNQKAVDYYRQALSPAKVLEVVNAA